jgi:hypothetical protein
MKNISKNVKENIEHYPWLGSDENNHNNTVFTAAILPIA